MQQHEDLLLKLVRFESKITGRHGIGALVDNGRVLVDLTTDNSPIKNDMRSILANGKQSMKQACDIIATGKGRISVDEVKILAPIIDPPKVIGVGLNYKDHALEAKMAAPSEPVIFTKFSSSIVGPNANIIKPKTSDEVDYEVELVIVIGREGRSIPESEALDYVAGYTIGNDVSARDWQLRKPGSQWSLGKSFDTFSPIGPSIVINPSWAHLGDVHTAPVLDPNNLGINLTLNGKVMQNSNTKEFIFPVQQVVSYLSQVFTLTPGDIIFTGTPAGVGFTRSPPIFLQPGDHVTCSIEHLGSLSNKVV
ncbi:hypothetical protein SAMD00019534_044840 [Acytostelium subglobosum LB1]|uniref:hypothetical protein n=1 Tax=Acytostelium subglobosum LB1 TaxID=1410327 RepID=UPI000644DE4C|nr:hypothetical protein SAMD00019534_044840 [Acytostelium subglobosum LB1]GAM21309.1 hypothetical protein SAMD00019534_044840 [Acytostelium subglobosum LB1]|eukprot:XP_012755428.1 hypothetical protein SAMD00019534_044840 [Acytostelium subglobosum LB1]